MTTPAILTIIDYLKDTILVCENSCRRKDVTITIASLIKKIQGGKYNPQHSCKYPIDDIKKYFPTLMKFKHINDMDIFAINEFNNFVKTNLRLPERGELVIDGFWDLHKLKNVATNSEKSLLLKRSYGIYKYDEARRICRIFYTFIINIRIPGQNLRHIIETIFGLKSLDKTGLKRKLQRVNLASSFLLSKTIGNPNKIQKIRIKN